MPYCLNTLMNVSVPSVLMSANWFPLFHFLDQKCWPLTLEDGTDRLYWNVGRKLPFYAVGNPKRAQKTTKEKTHSSFTLGYSSHLPVQKRIFWQISIRYLTFIGPCIVIYFYSKTNQIHQRIKFMTLYMLRTVSPSVVQDGTYSNRHLSNRYCCLLASIQTAVSVWQMTVAACTVLKSWWWTERPSETCRVSFQNKINLIHWCI